VFEPPEIGKRLIRFGALVILSSAIATYGLMALMRYPQISPVHKSLQSQRVAVALTVLMIVVIAVPLGITGRSISRENGAESVAAQATRDWVQGTGYQFVSATSTGQKVTIVVAGQGPLPPQQQLRDLVSGKLSGMPVEAEIVPTRTLNFPSTPTAGSTA
jgi:hypothetical protein